MVAFFENLQAKVLHFTARNYFYQIFQREHHHAYYRQLQKHFGVHDLYTEVRDEVRDIFQFLNVRQASETEKNQAKRDRTLQLILAVAAIASILLAWNQVENLSLAQLGVDWPSFARFTLGAVFSCVLLFACWRYTRQGK